MKNLEFILLAFLLMSASTEVVVPVENKDKGKMPPMEPAIAMAEKIVQAVNDNQFENIKDDFFPEQPFIKLKTIKDPDKYYVQLVDEYKHHFNRVRETFSTEPLVYKKFKKGYCKWKDVNTQYNSIPYWSCYNNAIVVTNKDGSKEFEIYIKTMINWGKDWKVTHLGFKKYEKDKDGKWKK